MSLPVVQENNKSFYGEDWKLKKPDILASKPRVRE